MKSTFSEEEMAEIRKGPPLSAEVIALVAAARSVLLTLDLGNASNDVSIGELEKAIAPFGVPAKEPVDAMAFDFPEALARMRAGKSVRRKQWGETANPMRMRGDSRTLCHDNDLDTPIDRVIAADLLADDWVEVEELHHTPPAPLGYDRTVAVGVIASLLTMARAPSFFVMGVHVAIDTWRFKLTSGSVVRHEAQATDAARAILDMAEIAQKI